MATVGVVVTGYVFLFYLQVQNVIEKPHNDHLPLIEASRFVLTCYSFSYSSSILFFTSFSFERVLLQ